MKPKKPVEPQPAEPQTQLMPDLEDVYVRVGPANYARATAKSFAKGGKYNPSSRRRRLAEM